MRAWRGIFGLLAAGPLAFVPPCALAQQSDLEPLAQKMAAKLKTGLARQNGQPVAVETLVEVFFGP